MAPDACGRNGWIGSGIGSAEIDVAIKDSDGIDRKIGIDISAFNTLAEVTA
jgi:hypothetical protein